MYYIGLEGTIKDLKNKSPDLQNVSTLFQVLYLSAVVEKTFPRFQRRFLAKIGVFCE